MRTRQTLLVDNRALTFPTGPADPTGILAPRRAQLSDAAIDHTAGQPSRLGGRRDTTIVPPQRFVGSEQTPATLIKMHRYVLPASEYRRCRSPAQDSFPCTRRAQRIRDSIPAFFARA